MLLGGAIGAGITWNQLLRAWISLGPAKAALLIVISQLIVAYVIELLGLFGIEKEPLEWRKVERYGAGADWSCNFPVEMVESSYLSIEEGIYSVDSCKGANMRDRKRE